ncbi:ferritin-like domain-containing protein [Asticcacaulis sp.]|uniref:ferritin-like domain-containing protein n=1 Tax=Asticcacaulis sp. TaxID=1872648 RepID=UPI00262FA2CD|nr:ferritin-like domain-containing protein [Asticcacaulis sp.]
MADGHKTLIATLKNALKVADEAGDDPTVDLLTVRLGSHEKHLWMISASLED